MTYHTDIRDKIAKIIQDKMEWAYGVGYDDDKGIEVIWLINPWELADKIIKELGTKPKLHTETWDGLETKSLPIEPTNPIPDGEETPMP